MSSEEHHDRAPRCVNCGETLEPVNWSNGPGWRHERTRESRCMKFAHPEPSWQATITGSVQGGRDVDA